LICDCDRSYQQSADQARPGNELKIDRANIVTILKAVNAGIQVMIGCVGKAANHHKFETAMQAGHDSGKG
jgi:hypothetical protein